MEVPVGFAARLWSFISFLPFFFSLFTLGLLKAAIVGPIVLSITVVGNSAVIIGLWPAHVIWTYFCVAKSKKLGLALKLVALVALPIPLILWPVLAILASFLGGIGYGFFAPLISTFEARGQGFTEKLYHYFVDGTWSTVKGSLTAVTDLVDFCFHSYFSFMDELIEQIPADEKPVDINVLKLPGCVLACVVGLVVDVPMITGVAVWKSPYMLLRGWKRLFEDLIGREGPFLETVCVPFAGLAILLWPLAVIGAVLGAFASSFFLALYAAVIVHQEDSLSLGFAYTVSVVSMFDEYVNDMLYLREGSCLPRPKFRRDLSTGSVRNKHDESRNGREGSRASKLTSEPSRTLKWQIQQYKPMQVWDWLFKSCEVNGRRLIRDGLIDLKDVGKCIADGDRKKLGVKLPAWAILECLLRSAKSDSAGLLISDDAELTRTNGPRDRVFEWFIGPLLVMKEQIKSLNLDESEEACLKELLIRGKNERPEDWDETCFPSGDKVRRAQVQAILRRLQGLVASVARIPTFRRRFRNLVKVLYLETLHAATAGSTNQIGQMPTNGNIKFSFKKDDRDIDDVV